MITQRINRCFSVCLLSALGLVLLVAPTCRAEVQEIEASENDFTIKGFGTLGVARSNNDTTEFVRDLSQPDGLTRKWSAQVDSLIGLQAGLKIGPRTEGVVQVLSRYRYDGSYHPELSWAYLRHELSPDDQVRVGRLGTEFFMLADSRMVGYANLTVRPPPDFYGPLVFSYLDGVDASMTRPMGTGLLRGKLFAGWAAEHTPLSGPVTWNLRGSRMVGGHLDYLSGPWQMRYGYSRVRFAHEEGLDTLAGFDIFSLAPSLVAKDTSVSYNSLGLVYDDGPIQVQAMLNRVDYETAAYENSRAGYVIASYRLPQLTPYVGYSWVKSTPKEVAISAPPAVRGFVSRFLAATHSDQHTITLGARWDFRQNMALKAQFDAIRGSPGSVFPFRGSNAEWSGRMNVFSMTLDFVF